MLPTLVTADKFSPRSNLNDAHDMEVQTTEATARLLRMNQSCNNESENRIQCPNHQIRIKYKCLSDLCYPLLRYPVFYLSTSTVFILVL